MGRDRLRPAVGPRVARRTGRDPPAPWSSPRPPPPRGRRSSPSNAPRRPRSSASWPTDREGRLPPPASPGAATVMSPSTCEPERRAERPTSAPTSAGGHPLRPGWPRACRPGPAPGRPGRSGRCARPRPAAPRSARGPTSGASAGTLLRCTAPRKCHAGVAGAAAAAALATQLGGVVLPQVRQPGGQRRPAPHRGRTPWSRRPPGPRRDRRRPRAMRWRTVASRSRDVVASGGRRGRRNRRHPGRTPRPARWRRRRCPPARGGEE